MLFLFRAAPEVEKIIHSKLFCKFWEEPGYKRANLHYCTRSRIMFWMKLLGTREKGPFPTLNLPCGGPDTISCSVAVSNVTPRYGFPWWVLMMTNHWSWQNRGGNKMSLKWTINIDFLCLWPESIWWIKLRYDLHWPPWSLADGLSTDGWKTVC